MRRSASDRTMVVERHGQVMDVRDVGLEVVDDARGDGADRVVPVCLLERARARGKCC